MSIYSVHKIAHQVQHNPVFRAQMQRDSAATIASFRLTEEERRAILSGDVGTLAQLVAHGYLLGSFARHEVCGVNMDNYVRRIHQPGLVL
jgi:hypothetical protein